MGIELWWGTCQNTRPIIGPKHNNRKLCKRAACKNTLSKIMRVIGEIVFFMLAISYQGDCDENLSSKVIW